MKRIISIITKNSIVRMIFALAVVGALSSGILVNIYTYSIPKIEINVKAETEKAIGEIFLGTKSIEKIKGNIFKAKDVNEKILGYAFLAEGNGYQGAIKLLIGTDKAMKTLKGIEVLESQETPGLGAEINTTNFKNQFKGLELTRKIEYVKNQKPSQPYEIEAITGATISSRAVVNIINKRVSEIKEALKE